MIIGNPSSASIAASVWTYTGLRAVTSSTTYALAIFSLASVGAGIIQDMRPAAGKYREIFIQNTNNTSFSIGTYDGTTFTISPASYTIPFYINSMNAIGVSIKNVSASPVNALWSGVEWS